MISGILRGASHAEFESLTLYHSANVRSCTPGCHPQERPVGSN